jgi:hypothetical protein
LVILLSLNGPMHDLRTTICSPPTCCSTAAHPVAPPLLIAGPGGQGLRCCGLPPVQARTLTRRRWRRRSGTVTIAVWHLAPIMTSRCGATIAHRHPPDVW